MEGADQNGTLSLTESLRRGLQSSSPSIQIEALRRIEEAIHGADGDSGRAANQLLLTVLNTYTRSLEKKARKAVQTCLRAYIQHPSNAQDVRLAIAKFLVVESQKSVIAPTNAFVLLEYCVAIQDELASHNVPAAEFLSHLCVAAAIMLDKCSTPDTRDGLRHGALAVARRGLRKTLFNTSTGEHALDMIVKSQLCGSPAKPEYAVYLGVIAGVCARREKLRAQFQGMEAVVLDFYNKFILSSKTALPAQQIHGLDEFLAQYVSEKSVDTVIVPALEKAILRSPESVLQGPITGFSQSLPSSIDVSQLILAKLLKPFLSSMNSTNSAIRDGAAQSLSALLAREQNSANLSKIAAELISNVKSAKAASYELRGLISDCLASIRAEPYLSENIVQGLTPVAAKEANESALRREVSALSIHLPTIMNSAKLDKSTSDAVIKGCGEKRAPFKKIWVLGVGKSILDTKGEPQDETARSFVTSALNILQDVYAEISPSPLPPTQSGIVSMAFVLPALVGSPVLQSKLFKPKNSSSLAKLIEDSLNDSSFLLNSKVYSRLTTAEDQRWVLRALLAISQGLANSDSDSKTKWARAMIHLLLSSDVDATVRKEAGESLSTIYLQHPESIGSSIVLGIWHILHDTENNTPKQVVGDDTIRRPPLERAITCISPPQRVWEKHNLSLPTSILKKQAVSTVVLLRPELIPGTDWISNCLLIGVDPGELTVENAVTMLDEILSHFQTRGMSPLNIFERAACRAAATLAFVAPDTVPPLLIQQFSSDLDPEQLNGIEAVDAMIARASDGVVVVDVLSKTNGVVQDKNRKDNDLLKWEEEMRTQLAKKKGAPQKRLTPDQQAKVDAQEVHERAVRQEVHQVSSKIRRGAGFVHALAVGPPTDARLWMSPAVNRLGAALSAGAALIVDDELTSAYLVCASKITERIGSLRPFIGVATLRSIGNVNLAEEMQTESLADLTTRVLYRLRFASEQRPFDTASLAYSLPLIFAVLDANGLGKSASPEDADAQVLLALEFLSFQMSLCSDPFLPRVDILKRLITSMQKYPQHYRLAKDSLMEFALNVASTIVEQERDVFLQATTLPEVSPRSAALQAVQSELELPEMDYSVNIWIACQDEEDDNAELALAIWEENEFSVQDGLIDAIPEFLFDQARSTRTAAAKALAQALAARPQKTHEMRIRLQTSYQKESQPIVPKRDKFGIVQKGDLTDQWEKRSGLALAFKEMAGVMGKDEILLFTEFLVSDGPLSDRNATVRDEMVSAGTAVVTVRGKESLEPLMKLFEKILQTPDKGTQEADWVSEAVIVLYGSVAQHLPAGDARLKTVLDKLMLTLSTPSESVQSAVSGCLPALVRAAGSDADSYVTSLLDQLFTAKKYAARRGAAYGLAGIVKGKGLNALRKFRIMSSLHSATEDKKSAEHREGALFAYELFSLILGRTFEPYVVEVLPQLLACFGDPSASVREACLDTAKTCFSSLSSYGVHQVLPRLLEGLEETQWRSKKGACDLLGAMAYLDPQQLATSLPDIIPSLTAVLTDTHKEVRAAANNSLKRFGEVISNPEVKSLVDILLKALSDPTKYTDEALDSLIRVSFVHYLDSPSLALVVRILERGLNDRSSTKRKAAQIIGSLANLTEKRDIVIHLPILVTGLRAAAVDPVPATRATASKALGSLIEKLGEDAFPDLIPSLMSSLRTDTGAGDRLGSAQALSEVLAGLGTGRLEETLPTILQNVQSTRATVREGFMTLFIYLPACFGNSFANYLGQIIPSILSGLADDIEAIRDIALRAGRLLVKNFANKAIDLLLPELQRGLADDSYRIRLSSVELVGDLLFSLTGISAKTEAEEEGEQAAAAGQSLLEVLGEERRNKVLSSLYICRCDTSGLVRAAAIAVWKALVATPRTLRELVPTLTLMIIQRLGSSNMEHKVIAGNALGEVIRKAGDSIFTSLLPLLEDGLVGSTDADNRQGICIALREVVNAATPDALEDHEKKLISIVRLALVDSDDEVREAAAESFDALQQVFGKRAVDQVLPHLLRLLSSEEQAENALSALLTLLTEQARANAILPNLIPTLLTDPITSFNARALASLAKVGGSAMNRRIPLVLNTISDNIIKAKDSELRSELNTAFNTVLCAVDEYDGLNTAMSVMLTMIKHDDHRKRVVAAHSLGAFVAVTELDFSRYNQDLIRVLLNSFADRDRDVVQEAWSAMSKLQTRLRKEEMETLSIYTGQVLKHVGTPGHNLPGFALPKGIQPVLAIFLQALMNGSADQKLRAAEGISDIIDKTSPESLKAFVTQITGPLIRVVGERSVDVKCAIILALNQLLEKIPQFLRPFLPQLQRTFTKCVGDPSSDVLRNRAIKALSTLITLTPRIDPLITELVTGARTPDADVRNAMLKALQEVVSKVGGNMSEGSRDIILGLMDAQSDAQDDNKMVTMARLLGSMVKVLPPAIAASLVKSRVLVQPATNSSILAFNAVLAESAKTLSSDYVSETRTVILNGLASSTFIQHNAILASGKFYLSDNNLDDNDHEPSNAEIFERLGSKAIKAGNDIDSRRLGLVVIRTLARHHHQEMQSHIPVLAASIWQCLRDPIIPIKLAAEAAWLTLFDVVDSESEIFDAFIEEMKTTNNPTYPAPMLRMFSDYHKRVALRLAAQKREQKEAEGGTGGLGLAGDEAEDEREVWSVGKVDLGEVSFD